MFFDVSQVERLIDQKPITNQWPWSTCNESTVDDQIRGVIGEVTRNLGLLDKTDYDHYGSGYASYVDCWLYRNDSTFRTTPGNAYCGLVVLFSRLSNYYVLGQGGKSWSKDCATSYLPAYDFVDYFAHQAVSELEAKVPEILSDRGWVRLRKEQLSSFLPETIAVPTILTDSPFREFDCLFYWED